MSTLTTPSQVRPAKPTGRRRSGTPPPQVHRQGPLRIAGNGLVWAFVAFNILLFVFMLLSSVKPTTEIFDAPWGLPTELRWENWNRAWNGSGFGKAALNTVAGIREQLDLLRVVHDRAEDQLVGAQSQIARRLSIPAAPRVSHGNISQGFQIPVARLRPDAVEVSGLGAVSDDLSSFLPGSGGGGGRVAAVELGVKFGANEHRQSGQVEE